MLLHPRPQAFATRRRFLPRITDSSPKIAKDDRQPRASCEHHLPAKVGSAVAVAAAAAVAAVGSETGDAAGGAARSQGVSRAPSP